jgi:AcrR family transcriptional regulator
MLRNWRMADRERKPGKSDRTRAAILAAAQELFAEQGYERTTVRDVAARAGIDPALVIRYFDGKEGLFARAAVFDLALPDPAGIDRAELGPVLVRHFLEIWEGPGSGGGMTILLRSAASNPVAAEKLQEVFASQVLPALARATGAADASARVGLVASQLLGIALSRYVLKLPPVVALPPERIIREVGETVQRYLDGDRLS